MTPDEHAIFEARSALADRFVRGRGIEVGAGARPFPVPKGALVNYGDVRDRDALKVYFAGAESPDGAILDAQTFAGVPRGSLDFIISAHVVEHLRDPIGAIVNAVRRLAPGGTFLLVVPDKRLTWDRDRPNTSVDHAMLDFKDGGESTTPTAYREHLTFVHPILTGAHLPAAEIERQAVESARRWRELDVHFHAWDRTAFEALLVAASTIEPFVVEEAATVVNENQFALRR